MKRLFDQWDIGILTRHTLPYEIEFFYYLPKAGLASSARQALRERGYDEIYDEDMEETVFVKGYGPRKYTKTLVEQINDDVYNHAQIYAGSTTKTEVNLVPENISGDPDISYFPNLFNSTYHVFACLLPFWFYAWDETYNLDYGVMGASVRDYEDIVEYSKGCIIEGIHHNHYRIKKIDAHPAFIHTGVMLMQSILARKFTGKNLSYVSEIYLRGPYLSHPSYFEIIKDFLIGTSNLIDHMIDYDIRWDEINETIPGVGTGEFTLNELFIEILREYTRNTGTIKDRCSKLSLSFWRDGELNHTPYHNYSDLSKVHKEEFEWGDGPEVR